MQLCWMGPHFPIEPCVLLEFKFSRLPHPHRCTRHPRTTPPTKTLQVLDCSLDFFLSQISTKKLGKPSSRQALEGGWKKGNSKLCQIVHSVPVILEKNHEASRWLQNRKPYKSIQQWCLHSRPLSGSSRRLSVNEKVEIITFEAHDQYEYHTHAIQQG